MRRQTTPWLQIGLFLVMAQPNPAAAQTTVNVPNTLDASLAFQGGWARGVFFERLATGKRPMFEGPTLRKNERHKSFLWRFDTEYSTPLPGLAVKLSLPMVIATEEGNSSFFWHPGTTCRVAPSSPLSVGEDCSHPSSGLTLTDLTLGLRYMLLIESLDLRAVPSLVTSFPAADYPIWGHDNVGTGLATVSFGLELGRSLAPIIPELFIDVGYTFTLSESILRRVAADAANWEAWVAAGMDASNKPRVPYPGPFDVDDVRESADQMPAELAQPNRSDMYVRLGYFIHPTVAVVTSVNVRIGHGGFTWSSLDNAMEALPIFTYYHDPLARTSYVVGNLGASWAITDWLTVYGLVYHTFAGSSTMQMTGGEIGVNTSTYLPDLYERLFGDDSDSGFDGDFIEDLDVDVGENSTELEGQPGAPPHGGTEGVTAEEAEPPKAVQPEALGVASP